jgi:hypothetical protein
MKAQKQRGVKAPEGQTARLSLRLSVEASRRLWVTAVMSDRTASAIVESLILDGLRSWSMPSDLSKRHLHQSAAPTDSDQSPVEIAA